MPFISSRHGKLLIESGGGTGGATGSTTRISMSRSRTLVSWARTSSPEYMESTSSSSVACRRADRPGEPMMKRGEHPGDAQRISQPSCTHEHDSPFLLRSYHSQVRDRTREWCRLCSRHPRKGPLQYLLQRCLISGETRP